MMKEYRQSVRSAVCYFAVNIPLFFHNCIHFRSRSLQRVFYGSGSGSGSEQTVSVAPAPAPAPHPCCWLPILFSFHIFGIAQCSYLKSCARLMNQRQHDSSYQPLAMDSSPQLPSSTNYTTSTIVPRSNRCTNGRTVPPRTRGIHGPGRLPAEHRAPLFGDAKYL